MQSNVRALPVVLAPHLHAIVRSIVVALIPIKYVWDIADNALRVGVILPRACQPRSGVLYVNLARRVMKAKEAPREDGDRVLLVVDMRDGCDGVVRVDIVRKSLVADARETVADVGDLEVGDVQGEVDRVQQRDCGTYQCVCTGCMSWVNVRRERRKCR